MKKIKHRITRHHSCITIEFFYIEKSPYSHDGTEIVIFCKTFTNTFFQLEPTSKTWQKAIDYCQEHIKLLKQFGSYIVEDYSKEETDKIQQEIYYTESEVKELFEKLQHEMAQAILGRRDGPVIPTDFFEKYKKK